IGWGQIAGVLADGQRDVHQHEHSQCHDSCYRPWHPAAQTHPSPHSQSRRGGLPQLHG
ncbi:hypothetical protein M9458_021886, partial [Cirrhinus mrigala]